MVFIMFWSSVNPISVAKYLVTLCENEFDCDDKSLPTDVDKLVAFLLFEKFAKITSQYEFQEVEEYDTGGELRVEISCFSK